MNREVFAKTILALTETFLAPRGIAPSEGMFEGYWIALQGLTEGELKRAVARALVDCDHMPPPARLIAYAKAERRETSLAAYTEQQCKLVEDWKGRDPQKQLDAVKETIGELAAAKDVNRSGVVQRDPLVITEQDKQAALDRLAERLAERKGDA